jgi:serine/threonine protein kinase
MTKCKNCGAENAPGDSFCSECGKPMGGDKPSGGISGLETIAQVPTRPPKGKSASEALVLEPGTVFAGRYTIVSTIGQGGMGVVYKATETLAGREREIALKLIRADRLVNQEAIDKLISEGALTQDIRHPNVVAVYNVGEADGQPFVAMEYVDGVSLREWHQRQYAARQEIPMATVAQIIKSLLEGLDAAHKLNIIHRDLKPENIVLTGEPSPEGASLKILDFGIARAPGSVVNTTGGSAGTPEYMAPEQITNPDGVTPAADLYSVSIIFYEMLMDALPKGPWQAPSAGRPDVPAGIDTVIQRGLSNRAASRQQSVAEYRADLAKVSGSGRGPVPDPGTGGSLFGGMDKAKLRKWAIGGGAGLLGLIVLGAIIDSAETGGSLDQGQVIDDSGQGGDSGGESSTQPVGYTSLSGRWNTGSPSYFDTTVDAAGNFYGTGMSTDGVPIEIRGSIPSGSYQLGNAMIALNGRIAWGGDCHLKFTTYNPDGSVNFDDTFHVDHTAGAPCPARFGG